MSALTPGQVRVRELALPLAASYAQLHTDWFAGKKLGALYDQLYAYLRTDPLLKTDPVTSQPLGCPTISRNYISWLAAISQPYERPVHDLKFDTVIFYGSVAGSVIKSPDAPAWSGGQRWETTVRAILTLMADLPMYTKQMLEIRYYRQSGILVGSEGNHRLLAYVLVGRSDIPTLTIYDEQEPPDPVFNEALKFVESLFPVAPPMTYSFELPRYRFPSFYLALTTPLVREQDRQRVCWIAETMTEEEQHLWSLFWRSKFRRDRWEDLYDGAVSQADMLCRWVEEYREIRSRSRWKMLQLWFRRTFPQDYTAPNYPSLSWLERWLKIQNAGEKID